MNLAFSITQFFFLCHNISNGPFVFVTDFVVGMTIPFFQDIYSLMVGKGFIGTEIVVLI